MNIVGINGFGRIGRHILRASREQKEIEVRVINDIAGVETLAHLFRYDSTYGRYPGQVRVEGQHLIVDDQRILVTAEKDPAQLPWRAQGVEVALECSGHFNTRAGGERHLSAGARKVFFSAPASDVELTLVKGVNLDAYDRERHTLVSNASCTTNCLAPLAKVLHEHFGIQHGVMTTVHSYTNDQATLDQPHKDLRRARAAALSIIPTSTGAARAIGLVIPALKGKLDGMAIRVPTPTVSLVDLCCQVERPASVQAINRAFSEAAQGPMQGVLAFCEEPLVSSDFRGDPHSSTIDALSTKVLGEHFVQVVSWYDNEWGFAKRMVEIAGML